MSTLANVRTYLKTYIGLGATAPIWVNHLGPTIGEYTIVPLPGDRVLETYLNGGSLRTFRFALQSTESTGDDVARLASVGFYEAFAEWLDSQSRADVLPTLDSGKTPVEIIATGWAFLMEQGASDTGVHQIMCELVFEQDP